MWQTIQTFPPFLDVDVFDFWFQREAGTWTPMKSGWMADRIDRTIREISLEGNILYAILTPRMPDMQLRPHTLILAPKITICRPIFHSIRRMAELGMDSRLVRLIDYASLGEGSALVDWLFWMCGQADACQLKSDIAWGLTPMSETVITMKLQERRASKKQ